MKNNNGYKENEYSFATDYRNHYAWGVLKRKAETAYKTEARRNKSIDPYAASLFNKVIAHFDPDNELILKDITLFFFLRKCIKAMGYKTVNEAKEYNYELYELFFASGSIFLEKGVSMHRKFTYLKALQPETTPYDIAIDIISTYCRSTYFIEKLTEDEAFSFIKQKLDWALSTHAREAENKLSRVSIKLLDKIRKENIEHIKAEEYDEIKSLPIFSICSLDGHAYHHDDEENEPSFKDIIASPVNEEENLIDRSWIMQKHHQFFSKHAAGDLVLLTLVDIKTGRLTTGYKNEIYEAKCGRTNREAYAYILNKVAPFWCLDVNYTVNAAINIDHDMTKLYSWSENTLTKHGKEIRNEYLNWMKDPSMTYTPIKKSRKSHKACKANK